jgi:hypothetical protein
MIYLITLPILENKLMKFNSKKTIG